MTLDNMTGITEGSYTGFCKSQLITCNFVKACNGVCPFEDALKHADKMQTMNDQHTVDHDRDWIIGCIEHDGFIHTHRFDKANQIIHDALSADTSSDLISRDDAIEAIQNAYCKPCKERGDDYNEVRCRACEYDNAIIQIDALPSADTEWIPCSERLPDAEYGEGDSMLCCTESGLMYILYWNGGNWCASTGEPYHWVNHKTGWHDKVIAWMPLPKPYREESEVGE